jgi:hypothetical protein
MNVRALSTRHWYARRRAKRAGGSFCLILLLLCTSSLSAQDAQPSSYAGFEGRNVAKVEISVRPTLDVKDFRPLIKQKPGAPFSMAAVRDSVTSLQKTNEFSQVQVSVESNSSIPVGQITLMGTLRYQSAPHQTFLAGAHVDGRLNSAKLTLRTGKYPWR